MKYLLKTNRVVAALPRVELTKMLRSSPGCPCRSSWTIDEISETTAVSRGSCRRILMEDLMMKRVDAKFVICRDLQGKLKDDPQFLTKDVTGDDSWCFGYDPESKQQ